MTVLIRETRDDDARGAVAIVREINPHLPITVESWLHRRRTVPARARQLWLTAEEEGEVVGRKLGYRPVGRMVEYLRDG